MTTKRITKFQTIKEEKLNLLSNETDFYDWV